MTRGAFHGGSPALTLAATLTLTATLAATATCTWTRDARADDPRDDPRCRGTHSLFAPLPDECLEVIDTDRPHQTDTPHVVPAGHTQIESAVAEVQLGGNLGAPPGQRDPRLVLFDDDYKFGVVSRVDVQLLFPHAVYDPLARQTLPPGPLGLRAKFVVRDGSGGGAAISLVPWFFLPVAPSQPFRAGPYAFFGWELGRRFELEANVGFLFSQKPKLPLAVVLASALTYTVAGELRVFVDAYATGPDIALGTGMLWAFARDFQVDLGTYVGLHGDEPIATPFLGLSGRR